jgi:hypothetical protein
MPELHPERTRMFEVTCQWKGEPKTALIIVYFCKNGKVNTFAPVDCGFWLTHRNRPLNWAVWNLRNHLQKHYQKGGPVPDDVHFWGSVAMAAREGGADGEMLRSISPKRFPTEEDEPNS